MGNNSFSFSVKSNAGNRKAYRAKIDGLHVKVVGRPSVYSAVDLSPTGVGLNGAAGMREGRIFEISLFHKGKQLISGLQVRVIRATASFTGLVFVDLDPRQTDAVHALVLSEQKRQVDERNKDRFRMDF
ncbi:PilZ domain-containing protein [Pseudodesulfovibrio sediminis]|uniref:PilZ domain-containing protein n=1 Tax=Pseudodesulfovibrio sediminis TaxID=2810563 RepID=A0ABN6EXC3_9BACT|nr:PilZ domain-containing protein [Pseudodesulfovibrio sediminis]BCS90202.1 hypothetical protein PSDVSF_34440 [Pseudodesulfovibrio sediminis]